MYSNWVKNEPIEVTSTSHWNTTLRSAKETGHTIIVDFHAVWCGPCKQIAPFYTRLATEYPQVIFLRVDVDQQKAIAAKYRISAMPTFITIKAGTQVETPNATVKGADMQGLSQMLAAHAGPNPPVAPLPPAAEEAKNRGNEAFRKGEYARAIDEYTTALDATLEKARAVLFANRSIAYVKRAKEVSAARGNPSKGEWTPPPEYGYEDDEAFGLITKAMADGQGAIDADTKWAKGWVRVAEATLAKVEEGDALGLLSPDVADEARMKGYQGAEMHLTMAIKFAGEGRIKTEAEAKLTEVHTKMKELGIPTAKEVKEKMHN